MYKMKYLFWCANEHIEFRIPEIKALASSFQIPIKWTEAPCEDPYIILELEDENDARKLISKSMLVRACYELWGQGITEQELHNSVKEKTSVIKPHLNKDRSFRISVSTFNKTLTKVEKLEKIESFSYLPFEGKVSLQSPEVDLHLIEYYGLSPNNIPSKPFQYFFGRWLSDGQRDLIHSFSLKKRTFIGSTSMDAQLAFLMTNMAQVKPGSIVMDPFVGTGSILVSAAQRGAYVWGWDIDFMTLHGRTKPTRYNEKQRKSSESILDNLKQYGLESKYIDVTVMDSSNPGWRKSGLINAIITDPPYGIRESTEKVGTLKEKKEDSDANNIDDSMIHYPAKMAYNLADIFVDLLNFSAIHLALQGRLVFWVPVFREDYTENVIPSHPCLRLESNCEQVLNTHSSRRLITLVKFREPQKEETAVADSLAQSEEFRIKFFQASQLLTKLDRQKRKQIYPTDKRGQGLGYRIREANESSNNGDVPKTIINGFHPSITVLESQMTSNNSHSEIEMEESDCRTQRTVYKNNIKYLPNDHPASEQRNDSHCLKDNSIDNDDVR